MKIFSKIILLSLVLPFSTSALAGGAINKNKIISVSFQQAGFFLNGADWGNPNDCSRSNYVVLQTSDANYDKAYSLLLAAYMSGKSVSGYSDKCVEHDGQTYNMIRGFKYLTVSD